ncbi:MAG: oxygen-independent coproporphyrinogen III oxidase [Betaproteobacteria bacterium]|nr:oxygen-independent coproporphyrinogen III oxidase [Betaproteobacteria bacterium]
MPLSTTLSAPSAASRIEIDLDLIRRFDRHGPRYTSYPTADRFVESFDAAAYESWLVRRNVGAVARPLELYVHLPFCSTLCFYCGCNKIVTRDRGKGATYLKYLSEEIALQSNALGDDNKVAHMHWGGGTPNFFNLQEVGGLLEQLHGHFDIDAEGDYSIEVDPRAADAAYITGLRKLGFNRISLGVQDFDLHVQRAVHRIQSEEQTVEIVNAARANAFRSVNIDLIYGLPKQSLVSFERTLERVIAADPDRVAVYNYAHLPHLFKPQRRIQASDLPAPETRLKLLALAIRRLNAAGYQYIGMDHFAKVSDSLAVAQRQGLLHRNFQGYSTHADCDLLGLGVSAIGNIGPTYSQNFRTIEDYYHSLDHNTLPIMRGIELSADDLVRRAVIGALMCHFSVSKESFAASYLIDFDKYFATELDELSEFERLELVERGSGTITVTAKGRLLVRNIAMVFDRYLRQDRERRSYSRVI